MATVDLNADLGESFGRYTIGHDDELLKIITSANVACGFHAGDPVVMHCTLELARENNVEVGAHPGFNDLWGFGRRQIIGQNTDEIEKMLIYQLGAITGMASTLGLELSHYKVHGALSNMACKDPDLALATARAVKLAAPDLIYVVLPGTEMERAGEKLDLRMAREIFADRAYDDDGMLVTRNHPEAMIHDPDMAAARMVKFVTEGMVESLSGKKIPLAIDTICVHGDDPAAVKVAKAVKQALEDAGINIRPMARTLS